MLQFILSTSPSYLTITGFFVVLFCLALGIYGLNSSQSFGPGPVLK